MIYLDNAATTVKKPPEVLQAVMDAMSTLGNAGRGVNEASLDAARSVFRTRMLLADFFHAESPERIAFTSNSTEALNTAAKGLLNPGDHVITTAMEHNSVLRPLYEMEDRGISLTILPADEKGCISCDDLVDAIRPETKAVFCTHASNLTGNMPDLSRISRTVKQNNITLILDASQSAGVFDIDVQAMGIDILCFTGHKGMLGPQGTGGIYVRPGISLRPLKSGGSGVHTYDRAHPVSMPTALEAGTLNGHGIAGLGAAVEYLNRTGLPAIREREHALWQRFIDGVRGVEGVTLYGDLDTPERAAIAALNIREYDSSAVGDALYRDYGIAVRTGAHCAPLMHMALGTKERGAVRFSFSHFNTEEEIDFAIRAVRELAEE